MHLDCDRCAISVVHDQLLAIMDDIEQSRVKATKEADKKQEENDLPLEATKEIKQ